MTDEPKWHGYNALYEAQKKRERQQAMNEDKPTQPYVTQPTIESVLERIDRLGSLMLEQFKIIDERFNKLDIRLDRMESEIKQTHSELYALRADFTEFRSHFKEPA